MAKIFPDTTKQAVAWPGGYSILYLDDTPHAWDTDGAWGDVLCAKCAGRLHSLNPKAVFVPFVHWEGPPKACAECGADLPSEYGDPDNAPKEEIAPCS